ncbi:MAG: FKBP-type peptidyl-prolyl cis-trans isomerase [Bacteroidales bacterium]|nr:FKBP-type peptidyl-prolyl cis-trans isomerase [Bacteroidales bacterium]
MTNTYQNKIFSFSIILLLAGCKPGMENTDQIKLENRMDTINYIIGLDYGTGIREENIEANQYAIYRGLVDGLDDKSILPDSVKEKIIDQFNEELKKKMEEEGKIFLLKNREEGRNFMEQNRQMEGIVELASGLQYKILKEGEGPRPQPGDSVVMHYRAMFTDRTVFDMSYDRGPAGIGLNTVIKGLSEGIQLMRKGAIYELYIPPELAYGDQTFANVIPAGSTLIYSIELIDIIKK